eukprot:527817-Pleurochrysis_carterae.AAC.1
MVCAQSPKARGTRSHFNHTYLLLSSFMRSSVSKTLRASTQHCSSGTSYLIISRIYLGELGGRNLS